MPARPRCAVGTMRATTLRASAVALSLAVVLGASVLEPGAGVLAVSETPYTVTSSATEVQAGDTLTLTPVVETDAVPSGTKVRCFMYIEGFENNVNWVRMLAASDGCEPWTFTVPASDPGRYRIAGYLLRGDGAGNVVGSIVAPDEGIDIAAGGTPVPFQSNYPINSWAPGAIATTAPHYGSPVTIKPPAGATGCDMRIRGGYEQTTARQASGCVPWTFSIPARVLEGPVEMFLDSSDALVTGWTGTSSWTDQRPEAGMLGAMSGHTYVPMGTFTATPGVTGGYSSNLPAVFMGPTRYHVRYSGSPEPFEFQPIVLNVETGTCVYQSRVVVPVVDGACSEPMSVPGRTDMSNAIHGTLATILDTDGRFIAKAEAAIGHIVPMADVAVDAPAAGSTEHPVMIEAAAESGVPAAYELTAEPEAAASATSAASSDLKGLVTATTSETTIVAGTFSPSMDTSGDRVSVQHRFLAPGRYRVTATFTDVKGAVRSSSTVVDVADKTPPAGSITVAGGAFATRTASVTISTSATDPSGVSQIALSNDGTTWTTKSYASSFGWTLAAGNGTKTVWAKWRDTAGNWSTPRSDKIVLDTTAPTATVPAHILQSGTAIAAGKVPVRVSWAGSDATSGVSRYELSKSTDGGTWTIVSTSLSSPSVYRSLTPGHTYRLRARAVDKAGNVSAWAYGATFRLTAHAETSTRVRYAGPWSTGSSSAYWGGSAKASSTRGAQATFTFSGRSVAWVAPRSATRGRAAVYVDGTYLVTVDLYSSASQAQQLVWSRTWSTSATRAVEIRVIGTSGRPRVDLDGFITTQ